MSPSIELPTNLTQLSTAEIGKVTSRRREQQQQQQQQHAAKVVSPRELKDIVARLSRSPGDPLPPPPTRFLAASSNNGQKQPPQRHVGQLHLDDQRNQQQQHLESSFRPISSLQHPDLPPRHALSDLLPQAPQLQEQGWPLKFGSKMKSAGYGVRCCRARCYNFSLFPADGEWFMSPKTFSPQIVQQSFFQQQALQPQQQGSQFVPSTARAGAVRVGAHATMGFNSRASGSKVSKVRHWR